MRRNRQLLQLALALLCLLATSLARAEDDAAREARHRRVAERRAGVHLICHRGVGEFAQENTLEAYRAAFEWGADGNEIEVRAIRDGVPVCFDGDVIDQALAGYGDVADDTWDELRRTAFRKPGRCGRHCRIATLREALGLHRAAGGLVHLDVKRPGLLESIAAL